MKTGKKTLNWIEMGHKIQMDCEKGVSHWITQVPPTPYTRELLHNEGKNPAEMASALLNEFQLTDEETKEKFRPILEQWLNEMPPDLPDDLRNARVRDFIYEMF